MSSLKDRITEEMKAAMRAQEKKRLATIRLILAAVKQKEVDERITVNDEQMLAILVKLAKQRKESISQYEKAKRQDLVEQEQFELDIIHTYLPQPLSEEEIASQIKAAISQSNASSMKDMGTVMSILSNQLKGRADMAKVSALIKSQLS